MASNGDFSDEGSQPGSPLLDAHNARGEVEDQEPLEQEEKPLKSAMKKADSAPHPKRPELPEQPNPETLDFYSEHRHDRTCRTRQIHRRQGYF
ncbi:hypothetical protein DTO012A8_10243 [Penicillium roqueforti]|nr:hypothetical protein DTO012A8_10243 [Penicillium roqueforti]